jgi:hypothetical protein
MHLDGTQEDLFQHLVKTTCRSTGPSPTHVVVNKANQNGFLFDRVAPHLPQSNDTHTPCMYV